MAPSLGVEVTPIGVRDAGEIERGIGAIAHMSNAGLVVIGSALTNAHRHSIISLAARHKLPAIYWGMVAYSPMGQVFWISFGWGPATWIASLGARSLPSFRCKHRQSTSWSSIYRRRRHWV